MSKSLKIVLIGAVLLIVVAMVAVPKMGLLKEKGGPEKGAAALAKPGAGGGQPAGPSSVAVDVMLVKTEKLNNNIQSTGTILANEDVVNDLLKAIQ